tara:strand:+ start:1661 stop:1861 length:201 start_codon:yes stop_codon:yes gene_type:complete
MDVSHTKASLIALSPYIQKLNYLMGVDENSLRSNTRPLHPPNSLVFGGDNMGIKDIKPIHTDPIDS